MNRRTVTASLIFATPAFLAACATTITPSQLVADADLVTAGVDAIAPIVRGQASATDQAKIDLAVAAVHAADRAIRVAGAADTTLSVRSLVAGVQAFVPIALSYLPKGSKEAAIANALLILLPAILAAAGLPYVPPAVAPEVGRAMLKGAKG